MFDEDESSIPPAPEEVPSSLSNKWQKRETLEKIKRCRQCQKQVLASEERCAYCGALMDSQSPAWVITAAILLLIIVFLFVIRRIF